MAGLGKTEVDIKNVVKDLAIEVTLKVAKSFSFRLWLAYKLLWLVAKITPIAIQVIKKHENPSE